MEEGEIRNEIKRLKKKKCQKLKKHNTKTIIPKTDSLMKKIENV